MPHATPAQLAAARAMLQVTQRHVADETGLSLSTVRRYETGTTDMRADLLARLMAYYQTHGVLFVNRTLEGVYLEHGTELEDARVEVCFKI